MFLLAITLVVPSILGLTHAPVLASSNTTTGLAGNGSSFGPQLAKNGRLVFFESNSTTLDPSDTTPDRDVYLKDVKTGKLALVRIGDGKTDPTGDCYLSSVSANGRYVAFASPAPEVVPGVVPTCIQSYVHDRKTGATVLASMTTAGAPITQSIYNDSISANGRYHVFTTTAPNVVPGVANGLLEVYLRDLKKGTTELVSLSFNSNPANGDCYSPRVSADGRYVFFTSHATTLVPVDTNADSDVFVRDRELHMTLRASLGSNGELEDGSHAFEITPNGRTIVFTSDSDVLGDGDVYQGVYVRDMKTGLVEAAGRSAFDTVCGGAESGEIGISKNGRFVIFASYYTSIVMPDPSGGNRDVFVCDREHDTVEIATFGLAGAGIDDDCAHVTISSNGKSIAYNSNATNLTTTSNNGKSQVYVEKL